MDFPSIALLTDFGERDGFVGVMKGVILTRLSQPVPIIDISHQIEPQNIRQGLWVLENAYRYFPQKTIFVSIVDPGVGNPQQTPLLAYWPERQQVFIAPDNGLLTPIAEAAGSQLQLYDIRQSNLYRNDALSLHGRSQTFHGRDVYAPIAALMANAFLSDAVEQFLQQLGAPIDSPHLIHREPARQIDTPQGKALQGEIVATDIFGNLITNIPNDWVPANSLLSVSTEDQESFPCPFVQSYSANPTASANGHPIVAVPSSGGTIELSVFQGNAQQLLQAHAGHRIAIQMVP